MANLNRAGRSSSFSKRFSQSDAGGCDTASGVMEHSRENKSAFVARF